MQGVVTVFGGSGFVGSHVVRALARRGWRVRVAVRRPAEAQAAAMLDGLPIIVGKGYTKQDGGILRPVAWVPAADGSSGAPLRLEPLGGDFKSWAEAGDVNRHGLVLGWSDRSATDWTTTGVVWPLFEQTAFQINAGIGGAWYDPATSGQGQFIDVEPSTRFMFVSWFTYTDATSTHPGQQHWFNAQGHYEDDVAELTVSETLGGRFDDPQTFSCRSSYLCSLST